MGNSLTLPTCDPNVEFIIYPQNGCNRFDFPYPYSNQQFQQRVLPDEWKSFIDEVKATFIKPVMILGIVLLSVICIALASAVSRIFIAVFIIAFFGTIGYQIYAMRKSSQLVKSFNEGLFMKRGVQVSYQPGGEHRQTLIHVMMAYPATPAAASMLTFNDNSTCASGQVSSNANDIARIEAMFREQNDIFARGPLATMAGGGLANGIPPQQLGYPQAQAMPLQGEQMHRYQPVQAHDAAQQQTIQVQVPSNASPGSTIQITHNGALMNIIIPPNIYPGQVMTVTVPAAQPVASAQIPLASPVYNAAPTTYVVTAENC